VAIEEVEYLQVDKPAFENLLMSSSKLERYGRLVIEQAFITQERRVIQNLSKTAEQRYQIFTESFPNLEQRLSLKHIASYLGITPESLSRIRRPNA
jgi:CRP-like cAMP-binding protein